MSFKDYFTSQTQIVEAEEKQKKIGKITSNFEEELRKYFKIKDVVYSSFGVQVDFYKKIEKDQIQAILDPRVKVKFKEKSIFIEY